jgi:hypothetical protein
MQQASAIERINFIEATFTSNEILSLDSEQKFEEKVHVDK